MLIKRFVVDELFGYFNHDVEFRSDSRITLLHGPNGIGKTTLLRLLHHVTRPYARVWRQTQFAMIRFYFQDQSCLAITRIGDTNLRYALVGAAGEEFTADIGLTHAQMHADLDQAHLLEQIGRESWRYYRDDTVYSTDEAYDRFVGSRKPLEPPAPDWLSTIWSNFDTQFIETQRLRTNDRALPARSRRPSQLVQGTSDCTVEHLAEHLKQLISDRLTRSGELAAKLDRTFPKRLLETTKPSGATEVSIRERYRAQASLRDRLVNAGLLEKEEGGVPLPSGDLTESNLGVLWHYLDDADQKLAVYDQLLKPTELFKNIVDDHKFLHKKMMINKSKGFEFRTSNDDVVPLDKLSSGEQHEIVLTYELLFKSAERRLVLIDEPELSLHVLWQQNYLDDMERIAKVANLDFVIATHSPTIVGHRLDLMEELTAAEAVTHAQD